MEAIIEKKKDAISESMGKMYDLAIDHAIEVARQHYIPGQPFLNERIDAIVAKLKTLKK